MAYLGFNTAERFARVVAKLMRLPGRDVDSITGRQELFPIVEAHGPRTR